MRPLWFGDIPSRGRRHRRGLLGRNGLIRRTPGRNRHTLIRDGLLMCPCFPESGCWTVDHAMGSAGRLESSYWIGVSMPRAECRRWRLWKISRYSSAQ
jgi:hypothetical protein